MQTRRTSHSPKLMQHHWSSDTDVSDKMSSEDCHKNYEREEEHWGEPTKGLGSSGLVQRQHRLWFTKIKHPAHIQGHESEAITSGTWITTSWRPKHNNFIMFNYQVIKWVVRVLPSLQMQNKKDLVFAPQQLGWDHSLAIKTLRWLSDLSTQEESHSGGIAVEVCTTVTLLSTLMSQQWQLPLVRQRW